MYRLAGAATFAYAAGLTAGSIGPPGRSSRIPIASTLAFNAASILACLLAIIGGGAPPIVFVILAGLDAVHARHYQLLREPPMVAAGKARAELERPIATVARTGCSLVGVAAAAVFGLGPLLLGGEFGRIVGASGDDPSSTGRRCRDVRRRRRRRSSFSSRAAGPPRGSRRSWP